MNTRQTPSEPLAAAGLFSLRREKTALRAQLKSLCSAVAQSIAALDAEMKKPSDAERGKRIAKITNFLEIQYDAARHFGLGESLRTDKRRSKENDEMTSTPPKGDQA